MKILCIDPLSDSIRFERINHQILNPRKSTTMNIFVAYHLQSYSPPTHFFFNILRLALSSPMRSVLAGLGCCLTVGSAVWVGVPSIWAATIASRSERSP